MLKGSDAEVNDVARALVAHRLFWLMLVAIPVVGLPGCALGFTSAMALFVWEHWWQKLFAVIGVFIGLSTPFLLNYGLRWLHRIPARGIVAELVQMEADALAKCLAELPQPTYFNATSGMHGGAIAVDPASRKIAVVFGQMQSGIPAKTRLVTLNPGELRSWSAELPGVSSLSLVGSGHSSSDMLKVHDHNLQQKIQQAHGTGLRLSTENLGATEIFLNFGYEDAKNWVVLLDKLNGGRLEVPGAAVEFPGS